MEKVLIFGATGMLGHKLYQVLKDDFDVDRTARSPRNALEGMDGRSIYYTQESLFGHTDMLIRALRPAIVINCIGITKQRIALNEITKAEVYMANTIFPRYLSQKCNAVHTKLIHISTDCVFTGREGKYTENALPDAKDLYGRTKILGEVLDGNDLIIRSSFIGRELARKYSLLEWFISNKGGTIDGFTKAIFTGFPTITFSRIIRRVLQDHRQLKGLYHIAAVPIDKYTLLSMINSKLELGITVNKTTGDYCNRSLDAAKFHRATGIIQPTWESMIDELAVDMDTYKKEN